MGKLTIEHLAPYLPYNIELLWRGNIWPLEILSLTKNEINSKPILRPFPDLNKEIECNGEKIIPYDYLRQKCSTDVDFDWIIHLEDYCTDFITDWTLAPYWMVQKLFEWHFDVFGLIELGLAININDLII